MLLFLNFVLFIIFVLEFAFHQLLHFIKNNFENTHKHTLQLHFIVILQIVPISLPHTHSTQESVCEEEKFSWYVEHLRHT